ncbi:BZ3500_MvSof-1268-A1-R1_Chr6-3g08730 [Microbotryum saponariae]|uniref:BZ3500_MvSof-1268-A1-R1_Chr6-3g08730 protein n=1 Tax=Microbotryum saponariae TaxID=289078 RepID=A0A2X0LJR3_9BASI|nr:BZ3500_MvSof-1268-A1-R1_Chr6-3g08730 [Microbotryum saponariae]SDA07331.1 BZ3501_MvSof-1269-A2-R1_Chr6-2g08433 [Microbotryum saponariae]
MTMAELLAFDVAPADASLQSSHRVLLTSNRASTKLNYRNFDLSSCVFGTTKPTHLKLPPLVDARDTNFSLNWPT